MTREEFKHAYRIARIYGSSFLQPGHPARMAVLDRSPYVDHLEYRSRCAEAYGRGYKPLGVALKLYQIRKLYNTPADRAPLRTVQRSGFLQLVGRELAIKSWLQWGRVETELDELAGGLWVFGGEE